MIIISVLNTEEITIFIKYRLDIFAKQIQKCCSLFFQYLICILGGSIYQDPVKDLINNSTVNACSFMTSTENCTSRSC